jgi:hypothetical protein
MITTPVQPFATDLTWTPVDASISATIGSGSARGGFGLDGRGFFFWKVVAVTGTGADASTNYGYTA